MIGVGAARLLRKPFPPRAWMPEYSMSNDAHQGQSAVTFRSFVGGLMPNTPMRLEHAIYSATLIGYGTYRLPFLTQQPDEEIVDKSHDRFQDGLAPGDVIDPQIPRQQDRTEHQKHHDAPADDHGFRDLQPEHRDHLHVQLFFQSSSQRIHSFALSPFLVIVFPKKCCNARKKAGGRDILVPHPPSLTPCPALFT